jgi:hypothetical protein
MKNEDRIKKVTKALGIVKPFLDLGGCDSVIKITPIAPYIGEASIGFAATCKSGGWIGLYNNTDLYYVFKEDRGEDLNWELPIYKALVRLKFFTEKDLSVYLRFISDSYRANKLNKEIDSLKYEADRLGYDLVEKKKSKGSGGYYSEGVKLAYD